MALSKAYCAYCIMPHDATQSPISCYFCGDVAKSRFTRKQAAAARAGYLARVAGYRAESNTPMTYAPADATA